MKKQLTYLLCVVYALFVFNSCQTKVAVNVAQLGDNDLTTYFAGTKGVNQIVFDRDTDVPVRSYKIYSSGELPVHDPVEWKLKGSENGRKWVVVDERKEQTFCSRFQEILCTVQNPGNYKHYLLEARTAMGDSLIIADVRLFEKDLLEGWKNFKYPAVDFRLRDEETEGAKIYQTLVQNPDEYVKYHTQKVAEILYFSDEDPIVNIEKIRYTLKDDKGISAKGGGPPEISIFYSTQWVERSAKESLYKLDYETRGVLYHELTHGYQYEPKGCGHYGSPDKVFWSLIEGIADAVRTEAGLFDIATDRKPGGNWMDGYRTTGYFIQWMTTKDPDAIRKMNKSAMALDVWSWDAAVKYVFGPETTIEGLWKEYQDYLQS